MSNDQVTYPYFSTSVWLPNGQRVFFTIPITSYETAYDDALAFTNLLLAKGALSHEPGLEAGEQKELIVTVMRREKPSDGTPIIDFYPSWGEGGDEPWGTYKYLHMYMDNDKVAEFLDVSGLRSLEQIPAYDGQSALKRQHGKRHAKEVDVPTPFYVVRRQGAEKIGSDGKPYKPWEFVRFELAGNTTPNAPKQAQDNAQQSAPVSSQAAPPTSAPTSETEPIPYIAPGDKAWWPTFWKYITPMYDNAKHAQASVRKMTDGKQIDASKMTVAQAVEVVRQHLQEAV